MGMQGFFHDAHEVYTRNVEQGIPEWGWQATFATKDLALAYVTFCYTASTAPSLVTQEFEVRPV